MTGMQNMRKTNRCLNVPSDEVCSVFFTLNTYNPNNIHWGPYNFGESILVIHGLVLCHILNGKDSLEAVMMGCWA